MSIDFDIELETLHDELIEMGSLICNAIELAVKALEAQDIELARQSIEIDHRVDGMERSIEGRCLRLLLQQPEPESLRKISSALKTITDMERIGDQASDIAGLAIKMAVAPYIKELIHIPQMADAAIKMVRQSIDAFVGRDIELARQVVDYDDLVDNLFDEIKNELIDLMMINPANISQAVDFLLIAKYLERIGDHAVNIAEWVVFSITGVHA